MVFAIHFDDKMIIKRYEISNIHSYDMLTTEMNPKFVSL